MVMGFIKDKDNNVVRAKGVGMGAGWRWAKWKILLITPQLEVGEWGTSTIVSTIKN